MCTNDVVDIDLNILQQESTKRVVPEAAEIWYH